VPWGAWRAPPPPTSGGNNESAKGKEDKTRAARFIGWSRPKLYRRMRAYGIPMAFGRARARRLLAGPGH
jgi:hypothetical protein